MNGDLCKDYLNGGKGFSFNLDFLKDMTEKTMPICFMMIEELEC